MSWVSFYKDFLMIVVILESIILLNFILQSVQLPSVIHLNIILLNVVAPKK